MKPEPSHGLRHFSRIAFDAQALLHLHDRTLPVRLIDIAFKGALVQIEPQQSLVLHEKCTLVLPLAEGGEGVEMTGKVVHLEDQHVGIECQDIDVVSLTQLRRLLELNTGDAELMNRELVHLFTRG